jgi:hypothetical protein
MKKATSGLLQLRQASSLKE